MISLYDLYEDDKLVYVGITARPRHRLWEHIARGTVSADGSMKVVNVFETRSEAEKAERARIKEMRPLRNRLRHRPSKQEVEAARALVRHRAYAAMWAGSAQAANEFMKG